MKFEKDSSYWGVTFVKERRKIRKKFCDDEGDVVDMEGYEEALLQVQECLSEGLPNPVECIRPEHYVASVFVFGKPRHLGNFKTETLAAGAHDSALFHLWGFFKFPKADRFNLHTADRYETSPPPLLSSVAKLRAKLRIECGSRSLPIEIMDFTYADRRKFQA